MPFIVVHHHKPHKSSAINHKCPDHSVETCELVSRRRWDVLLSCWTLHWVSEWERENFSLKGSTSWAFRKEFIQTTLSWSLFSGSRCSSWVIKAKQTYFYRLEESKHEPDTWCLDLNCVSSQPRVKYVAILNDLAWLWRFLQRSCGGKGVRRSWAGWRHHSYKTCSD